MKFEKFDVDGPALIIPKIICDDRGYFVETFKDAWFRENICDIGFVQDNQSLSKDLGTIRGLHYQTPPYGQGKLVRCVAGKIFDVAVDIRLDSPSFGKWIGVELSAQSGEQLWIPEGFAHGFCTITADCIVSYKVTNPYSKKCDSGIAFDDQRIGINWPIDVEGAILSAKDKIQPKLSSLRA